MHILFIKSVMTTMLTSNLCKKKLWVFKKQVWMDEHENTIVNQIKSYNKFLLRRTVRENWFQFLVEIIFYQILLISRSNSKL
jgi:hypothetical protein